MLLSVDKIHIGVIDTTVNQETCRQSMVGRLLQNSTMYICMQRSILIQLQHRIFSFNDNIDSTSTLDIFIQRLYSFNFNTGYSCARQIFIQLQRPKLCFMKRIYLFNFNKKNLFLFNKTYLFNSSSSRTSINSYSTKLHLSTPMSPLI